jgi:transcriptional regulator with XRE-family HTH domain
MTFAEKLKSIRKQAGTSQEQLAEKLGVSRQAVIKWETDAGIPDIENMMAKKSVSVWHRIYFPLCRTISR